MSKHFIYILLLSLLTTRIIPAQHFTEHQYLPGDSIFNNPERGFYKYTSRNSASGSISGSSLVNYYNAGYTMIYRIYYLQDYVNQPISKEYLDRIREDFQVIRESGLKVVLRFAYTAKDTPPYGDASPGQVQEHIAQLKPILQENEDVIAVLQAGFIGAWGEWYYTDHFSTGSPENVTPEDLEERAELVYSLLDALPVNRQVQLRYVGYKMDFFGQDPITPEEAYSGNAKSRIAHHNDCFLSSSNDVGTYHSAYDRTYLKTDSKYTSVGGETCRWYEPRSNCDTTLVEMARYHWSFINIDYFGTTIQNWKDDGCFDDIQRKLGYRYQLISSNIQDSSRQEGIFYGSVLLTNAGFSNPYNPRTVELVMRNKSTQKEFFLQLETDVRKIPVGETIELDFSAGIPPEVENGTYELFLNLPDPLISIKKDPRYSIRLANENTWETETGYNLLNHNLIIHPDASAPEYTGADFFLGSDERDMPVYQDMVTDGKKDDWINLPSAFTSTYNLHVTYLKIYNDHHSLYFLAGGPTLYPNSRILIDADKNPATGMNHPEWQTNGMDFLVENSSVYGYTGENGSSQWSWDYLEQVTAVINDTILELTVPLTILGDPADTIRYGFQNGNSDWSLSEYIPDQSGNALSYKIDGFIDHPPPVYATHYSDNAIIYWGIRENDNKFRIIERSIGNENGFKVISALSPGEIAVTDPSLNSGETYFYRSYLTDNHTVSWHSPVISLLPGDEIFKYSEITADGLDEDWNAIKPVLSIFSTSTYPVRIFADAGNINFLVTGDHISGFEIFLETDDDPATGTGISHWYSEGIDYKIHLDSLFQFQSGWVYKGKLTEYVSNDSVVEFSLPFSNISLGNQAKIQAGLVLFRGSDTLHLPFRGNILAVYNRILPAAPPANFHLAESAVDPATRLIVRWDKCSNCSGNVIERKTGDEGSFSFLIELDNKAYQYIDDSLENHTLYSYRMYSYNAAGQSDYTRTLTGSTHDVGMEDQDPGNRFRVFTDPFSQQLVIRINEPGLEITSISLYDFSGRQVYSSGYPRRGQELNIPIQGLNSGIYLLYLNYRNGQYSDKIFIF